MTTYNKSTLKTFFKTGDVPTGTDYSNFIDSYVNIVETASQSMAGPLNPTKLVTPKVSATNANITGTVSALNTFSTNLTVVSANITNITSTTISAGTNYADETHSATGYYGGTPVIISAAGTTQATAATLTAYINRGQGSADGQTTGFILPSNKTGWKQYLIHEGAVSANLFPCVGGTINGLGTNAAFALAANTLYTIIHKSASAYAVK